MTLFHSYYRLARESIRLSRWRSLLTMLGIIIGVVSVITIISIGEGVKQEVSRQIQDFGPDLLIVRPGQTVNRDAAGNVIGINLLNTFGPVGTLTDNDVKTITGTEGVQKLAPLAIVNGIAQHDGKALDSGVVIATTSSFEELLSHDTQFGEFLTNRDEGRFFAVIGQGVAEQLFEENVPIGKSIEFRGERFVVKGVFSEFKATPFSGGVDFNNSIFIPYITGKVLSDGATQVIQILVKPEDLTSVDAVQSSLKQNLLLAHGGQANFTVLKQDENLAITNNILTILTALVAAVATVSLVVGGTSIMNIMLVSVTERTQEIGIRKAVGATNQQILSQFLVEAVVLSVVGGVLGVIVSLLLNFGLRITTDLRPAISLSVIAIALILSVLVGVIFGVVPALKAARKHPIDALRFE